MALAGVVQWIGRGAANQGIAGLIPVMVHAWVTGWVPSRWCVKSNQKIIKKKEHCEHVSIEHTRVHSVLAEYPPRPRQIQTKLKSSQ